MFEFVRCSLLLTIVVRYLCVGCHALLVVGCSWLVVCCCVLFVVCRLLFVA